MKNYRAGLFLALATTLITFPFVPSITTQASYEGTYEISISHSDDCECGVPDMPSYYVPGSIHKFELSLHKYPASGGVIARPFDDLTGYKYEWNSGGISSAGTLSTLIRSEGTTAWYQLEESGRSGSPTALVSASLSYTGYMEDGQTIQEEAEGGSTSILELRDEFWIASTNCNPNITITHGDSQKLQLYAQHFTLDDPLGKAIDDVTSWVDWSNVRTSGCGVTVSKNGVLETMNGGTGNFGISFHSAVHTPEGVILDLRSDPIIGTVTEDKNPTGNLKELKLKISAKKGTKKIIVKTDKKANVKVVISNQRYTFSSAKNKTGKVTVQLPKKLSKGQTVKVHVSKNGFADRHTTIKIK